MVKYDSWVWWEWNGRVWTTRTVEIHDGHQTISEIQSVSLERGERYPKERI